ncbi:MAG: TraR/DksA family transcriptional regulator [Ignavibacteria bacterium]
MAKTAKKTKPQIRKKSTPHKGKKALKSVLKKAKSKSVKKISLNKKADKKAALKKHAVRKGTGNKKKPESKSGSHAKMEILKTEAPEVRSKKIESIRGYSKKELDHFRELIIQKQNEIIEQLQNLKEQMLDPTTGEYINENSPYSLHMAEQGTDAMEREKTFLYAQRENKFLGYLEDALKRIDAGTYGICIDCIDEPQHLCETCPLIPKERLEAVPHSQLCLPMKQKQEKK